MDTDRLAMKWRNPERVIGRIVDRVVARAAKGDGFPSTRLVRTASTGAGAGCTAEDRERHARFASPWPARRAAPAGPQGTRSSGSASRWQFVTCCRASAQWATRSNEPLLCTP